MRFIFIAFFVFISLLGYSQPIVNRAGQANTVQDARWAAQYNMFAPRYLDTSMANLNLGIDSCGAIIYTYNTNSCWLRGCSPKRWLPVLVAPSGGGGGGGLGPLSPYVWLMYGNNGVSSVYPYATLGTLDSVPIYFKTRDVTRFSLPANGLVTGTSGTHTMYLGVSDTTSADKPLVWLPGGGGGGGSGITSLNGLTATTQTFTGAGGLTILSSGSNHTFNPNAWNLTGNSGTSPGTNFIGTTDNVAFLTKVNGIERHRVGIYSDSITMPETGFRRFLFPTTSDGDYTMTFGDEDPSSKTRGLSFKHTGQYSAGCTYCGLNSMWINWMQNDTVINVMGAHNGPDDKHFFLADFTDDYAGPGVPARRYMTVEKNGTPFFSWYNNPSNNNPQTLVGYYPGWVFTDYEKYRLVVGEKAAFNDTVYMTDNSRLGIGTRFPSYKLDVSTGDAGIYGVRVGRGPGSVSTNTLLGYNSFLVNSAGARNTIIGSENSKVAVNESDMVVIGYGASSGHLFGGENTVVGVNAGGQTIPSGFGGYAMSVLGKEAANKGGGTRAVAIGAKALFSATTTQAADNDGITAVGAEALYSQGSNIRNNTGVGSAALWGNLSGTANTAVGALAMGQGWGGLGGAAAGTGSFNTGVGVGSILYNKTSSHNTAIGFASLGGSGFNPTTGYNIAIGDSAGFAMTTGSNNVLLGGYKGELIATSDSNIVISDGAGTIRSRYNNFGALSFDGSDYGTASYVLTSNGSGSAPSWQSVGIPTATNGLTESGGLIGLGGSLISTTEVTVGAYSLNFGTSNGDGITLKSDTLRIDPPSGVLMIDTLLSQANADDSMVVWSKASQKVGIRAIPSGGAGITSINSQTGSSQTIAAGSAINVSSSSNTHTIALDIAAATADTISENDKIVFADNESSDAIRRTTLKQSQGLYTKEYLRSHAFEYFTDFFNTLTNATATSNDITATNSGTGAGTATQTSDGVLGEVRATTGSTATGRSHAGTPATAFRLGTGEWVFETRVNITTLSDGTQRFQSAFGFFDTYTAANQVDGVYFLYDEGGVSTGSTASANWQLVTTSNSTRTFTTTSTAVSAATWVKLRIEINADATSVTFFIDGTSVGTHTTNIPSAAGRELGFGNFLIKSVGTTARTIDYDYMLAQCELTTPR